MRTIVLPLWGWVLIAIAGILFAVYEDRARLFARVGTRRGRTGRDRGAWDCAIVRREPYLRKLLKRMRVRARLAAIARSTLYVLTAPWRWLCAYATHRRQRKIQRRPPPSPTAWTPIDYSAKCAEAIAWLGDEYLLAKPVNRLTKPLPRPQT